MRESPTEFARRYGISARSGFLLDTAPLERLPDLYYQPWETLAESLPELIMNNIIRAKIDSLPILDTGRLHSDAEWQRAYAVLGFLTHAYIWGGERPAERLPPQLSCPFLAVSQRLGLPPTAMFSTLSLLNFGLKTPDSDWANPDNLKSLLSFTNTKDEEWFYMVSTAIEAKGGPLILTMLQCIQAVNDCDDNTILTCLRAFANGIGEIENTLKRMYEHCDPQVFYHNIRPFCAGSKGMAAAGLPNGVFYDEGDGRGQWRQYSGGSNAQSSLIQLFDIFLAVEHHETGDNNTRRHKLQDEGTGPNGYLQEMRNYMQPAHREFLGQVERMSNLRGYISQEGTPTVLKTAYNDAVAALSHLRNSHIQLVARYIVMPSRSPPAAYIVQRKGANLATACSAPRKAGAGAGTWSDDASATRQLHGTGGTSVMPFLKRTRDETREAVL
ncbi:Indoleamine 2,3-dioxygenase [Fonsecaea pedrosoi]|nr:Indoleamine 2,3-dioxygenase [Fonsecaea pedrosoi]